jgi:hypothetical protein
MRLLVSLRHLTPKQFVAAGNVTGIMTPLCTDVSSKQTYAMHKGSHHITAQHITAHHGLHSELQQTVFFRV